MARSVVVTGPCVILRPTIVPGWSIVTRIFTIISLLIAGCAQALAQAGSPPSATVPVLDSLKQSNWADLQDGLSMLNTITPDGLVLRAYRFSPEQFDFSIGLQESERGSHAKDVGERLGAVVVANAGFFAVASGGKLYPVGYLRVEDEVLSKGWSEAGGTVTFADRGITLKPTHQGIPQNEFDVIQTRPMLIEPGGTWAMGSNTGDAKQRTLLCTMKNGDVVLITITRSGLTLFEAAWLLRGPDEGGHFNCDAAVAFDGGRSTQVWHSGEPQYSHSAITPVFSFFVVRQREGG